MILPTSRLLSLLLVLSLANISIVSGASVRHRLHRLQERHLRPRIVDSLTTHHQSTEVSQKTVEKRILPENKHESLYKRQNTTSSSTSLSDFPGLQDAINTLLSQLQSTIGAAGIADDLSAAESGIAAQVQSIVDAVTSGAGLGSLSDQIQSIIDAASQAASNAAASTVSSTTGNGADSLTDLVSNNVMDFNTVINSVLLDAGVSSIPVFNTGPSSASPTTGISSGPSSSTSSPAVTSATSASPTSSAISPSDDCDADEDASSSDCTNSTSIPATSSKVASASLPSSSAMTSSSRASSVSSAAFPAASISVPKSSSLSPSSILPSTSSTTPNILTSAAAGATTASPSTSAIATPSKNNSSSADSIAVYFGQTPDTSKTSLLAQCQDPNVNIAILAFLVEYADSNGYPTVNFGAACGGQTPEMMAKAPGLLYCTDLATQINQCQALGKKVLLSLGGSTSTSGFATPQAATDFATKLWNLFGAGTGEDAALRVFPNATIDGFDIDTEDRMPTNYGTFTTALRTLYATDPSKSYYISAAPQCPYPDASIPLDALRATDFVWVQFYNNPPCNIGSSGFLDSFATWSNALEGSGAKLYIGAPGCANCAGSGYLDEADFDTAIAGVKGLGKDNFGGVMLWDGTEAHLNIDAQGRDYVQVAKDALDS
ncbi:MAG: hypothetical protein M1827_006374 [Pycnora praestabilis]|nr:MAG: hypothetical protein M1827_006374 [Pycnora praestabilis]